MAYGTFEPERVIWDLRQVGHGVELGQRKDDAMDDEVNSAKITLQDAKAMGRRIEDAVKMVNDLVHQAERQGLVVEFEILEEFVLARREPLRMLAVTPKINPSLLALE